MLLFMVLAGLVATSQSQDADIATLPLCAQGCLSNSYGQVGSCSNADIKCLCSNPNYINLLACCLATQCSGDDQQKALAFTSKLCTTVSISISVSLGCPSSTTSSSSSKTSNSGSFSGSSTSSPLRLPSSLSVGASSRSSSSSLSRSSSATPSTTSSASSLRSAQSGTSASKSATPSITVGSVVSLMSNTAIAKFTGGALLGGSCAVPQFAAVTASASVIIEYPWLGCSYEQPGCCPFDIHVGGSLSKCPNDYTTTSSTCCPSGWSIYTTAFAGQTPCYSTPPLPLIPPTTSPNPANASISIISNKVFTLAYALAPPSLGPALSAGAKAGIAIGALVGALVAVAIGFFVLLRRRRNKASPNDEAGRAVVTHTENRNSAAFSNSTAPPEHISELPSPGPSDARSSWFRQPVVPPPPMSPTPSELPAQPPEELPGSTYMHEHHPAYSPGNERGEPFRPPFAGASRAPEEVVSPIEDGRR